jgi:hypothetical protein
MTGQPDRAASGIDLADPVAGERLDRRTIAVVAVMAAAAFMAVLDGTIVTVAIDTFSETFEASVATIGWVSVGYLLAAAVSLPVSSWAVERFGGRRVFLAASPSSSSARRCRASRGRPGR